MARVETQAHMCANEKQMEIVKLVKLAIRHQEIADHAQQQVKELADRLIALGAFDTQKARDEIVTAAGVAVYQRTQRLVIRDDNVDELKKIFGDEFDKFVQFTPSYRATKKLKELVTNSSSLLKQQVARWVELKSYEYVNFKPAVRERQRDSATAKSL